MKVAEDPGLGMRAPARVGRGVTLPQLSNQWRMLGRIELLDHLGADAAGNAVWRRNRSSVAEVADKDNSVLDDQAFRAQVMKLTKGDARKRHPNLATVSPSALRKDEPNGVVTASVFFHGTHGIAVTG